MVAAFHVGKVPPSIPSIREDLGADLRQAGWLLSLVNLTAALGGMTIALPSIDSVIAAAAVILPGASWRAVWLVASAASLIMLIALLLRAAPRHELDAQPANRRPILHEMAEVATSGGSLAIALWCRAGCCNGAEARAGRRLDRASPAGFQYRRPDRPAHRRRFGCVGRMAGGRMADIHCAGDRRGFRSLSALARKA